MPSRVHARGTEVQSAPLEYTTFVPFWRNYVCCVADEANWMRELRQIGQRNTRVARVCVGGYLCRSHRPLTSRRCASGTSNNASGYRLSSPQVGLPQGRLIPAASNHGRVAKPKRTAIN